jgi:hypothetical protein
MAFDGNFAQNDGMTEQTESIWRGSPGFENPVYEFDQLKKRLRSARKGSMLILLPAAGPHLDRTIPIFENFEVELRWNSLGYGIQV